MYKYLIVFVLAMPLVGIWFVEHGDVTSMGIYGEPNGATEAFAAFAGLTLVVAFLSSGRNLSGPVVSEHYAPGPPDYTDGNIAFTHFATRLLMLNAVFLLTMLFVFDGMQVWQGTLEKGVFRATLGSFGALPFLMTKFVVPALFAYSTLLLMLTDQSPHAKWLWRLNAILVFLAGSTWGFKTTGLFMLLPGLLVLNWKLPIGRLLAFGCLFIGALILFFFWFDAELMPDVDVLAFLGTRLTVLQGDVAWYIWGQYVDDQSLPSYWPTLLAAMGDTVLGSFVSKTNFAEWMGYHYDWMLTYLAGNSLEVIANGHSVTGTPFAEGVVAGGWVGVMFVAIIAGLLVGRTYCYLDRAIQSGSHITAAVLSTYFCFHIFSWLNGGAITQLFHVSVFVYLLTTFWLISVMSAPIQSAVIPASSNQLDLERP